MVATTGNGGGRIGPWRIIGWGAHEPPGLVRLVMLISGFAVMWLLSAILFDRAARAQDIAG